MAAWGGVVATGDGSEPFQLVDVDGGVDVVVQGFVRHLVACDYSPATVRSYLLSLLRWYRFLAAVGVGWDRAERRDVRDFVLWMRGADNEQRRRTSGVAAGSTNPVTGKRALSLGYAPATINHALSAVSVFYDYEALLGAGPVVNPVPGQQGRDGSRAHAHQAPGASVERLPRAPYRQRTPARPPRALSDAVVSALFEAMTCDRDRAILTLGVGSGPRASELLGMTMADVDMGGQLIALTGKGHRDREWVPASPEAMLWLASYLAKTKGSRPVGEAGLWWTSRAPARPLTYPALRQVLNRANAVLGSDVTFHDLRHTFAMRLLGDTRLAITDVQRLMRHRSLASTQVYARAQLDELVVKMREHYARPEPSPGRPDSAYDAAAMAVLFPDLG